MALGVRCLRYFEYLVDGSLQVAGGGRKMKQYTVMFIGRDPESRSGEEQRVMCYLGDSCLDFLESGIRDILSVEVSAGFLKGARKTPWSEVDFSIYARELSVLPPDTYQQALFFFSTRNRLPDLCHLMGHIPWSVFQVSSGRVFPSYVYIARYNPYLSPEIDWFPLVKTEEILGFDSLTVLQ